MNFKVSIDGNILHAACKIGAKQGYRGEGGGGRGRRKCVCLPSVDATLGRLEINFCKVAEDP